MKVLDKPHLDLTDSDRVSLRFDGLTSRISDGRIRPSECGEPHGF
jgi:hypothetical protein